MKANPNIKQHMMQTIEPVSKILNNDWHIHLSHTRPSLPYLFPQSKKSSICPFPFVFRYSSQKLKDCPSKYLLKFEQHINFYFNFQRNMYRNLTPSGLLDQTESQHKDAVISSLKKELF